MQYRFLKILALLLTFSMNTFAQEKVILDVKTKFIQKIDLAPAKAGTVLLLMQSDWATVRDFGEKYSIWLTEYKREKKGKIIFISLTVELRTPAMLRSGTLIETQIISVPIDETKKLVSTELFEKLKNQMKGISEALVNEGIIVSPFIVEEIQKMVKKHM